MGGALDRQSSGCARGRDEVDGQRCAIAGWSHMNGNWLICDESPRQFGHVLPSVDMRTDFRFYHIFHGLCFTRKRVGHTYCLYCQ